jgi:hypothetical protein
VHGVAFTGADRSILKAARVEPLNDSAIQQLTRALIKPGVRTEDGVFAIEQERQAPGRPESATKELRFIRRFG